MDIAYSQIFGESEENSRIKFCDLWAPKLRGSNQSMGAVILAERAHQLPPIRPLPGHNSRIQLSTSPQNVNGSPITWKITAIRVDNLVCHKSSGGNERSKHTEPVVAGTGSITTASIHTSTVSRMFK